MKELFTRLVQSLRVQGAETRPLVKELALPGDEPTHPDATALTPNDSYFFIWLTEMHLSADGGWGTTYSPCVVAVSEFAYGGSQVALPMVIGKERLAKFSDLVTNKRINFSNTPLVGPMPYRGGNIVFFMGLYGVKTSDLLDGALNLVRGVTSASGLDLKRYMDVADILSDGISQLLNRSDRVPKIGEQRTLNTDSQAGLADRYLLMINANQSDIMMDRLCVVKQSLKWRSDNGDLLPYEQHDYCLLKIFFRSSRGDYSQLPFYDQIKEARQQLLAGQVERAKWTMVDAVQAIDASDDLADSQKTDLMTIYQSKFEQLRENVASSKDERNTRSARTRSARRRKKTTIEPKAMMDRILRHSQSSALDSMVSEMSEDWGSIGAALKQDAGNAGDDDAAVDERLRQLRKVGYSRVAPREFVRALEMDALADTGA